MWANISGSGSQIICDPSRRPIPKPSLSCNNKKNIAIQERSSDTTLEWLKCRADRVQPKAKQRNARRSNKNTGVGCWPTWSDRWRHVASRRSWFGGEWVALRSCRTYFDFYGDLGALWQAQRRTTKGVLVDWIPHYPATRSYTQWGRVSCRIQKKGSVAIHIMILNKEIHQLQKLYVTYLQYFLLNGKCSWDISVVARVLHYMSR